jgi:hypothetical protein
MRLGKRVRFTEWYRLNEKFSIVTTVAFKFPTSNVKILEAINRNTGASCAEVEHVTQLLLVHLSCYLPEPFDDLMIAVESSLVLGVMGPVLHIDER